MELRSWEADPAPAHAPLALAWAAFAALAEQMSPAEGATMTCLVFISPVMLRWSHPDVKSFTSGYGEVAIPYCMEVN